MDRSEDGRDARRLDNVERDSRDHAKSISALTDELGKHGVILDDYAVDKAVRAERIIRTDEKFAALEKSVASIYSLGRWLLATVAGAFILALLGFVFRGGLNVGH